MADAPPARNHRRRRPSVLQWNVNSLRRRRADLTLYLQQSDIDVLALQEVYVAAEDLRLPGYIGYSSTTSCTLESCDAVPCLVSEHPQGKPRCAVYVRRELPHTHIDVANVTAGALECCAVTVRLRPNGQPITLGRLSDHFTGHYVHPADARQIPWDVQRDVRRTIWRKGIEHPELIPPGVKTGYSDVLGRMQIQ